jgi:hypothetical protein
MYDTGRWRLYEAWASTVPISRTFSGQNTKVLANNTRERFGSASDFSQEVGNDERHPAG